MQIFPFSLFESIEGFEKSSFKDPRDGQVYGTLICKEIGIEWFTDNLNYDIRAGLSSFAMDIFNMNDECLPYANDEANREKYGLLYTFDSLNLVCPEGWEVGERKVWVNLLTHLTGKQTNTIKSNDIQKIYPILTDPNVFNLIYGGAYDDVNNTRRKEKFRFHGIDEIGSYWTGIKGALGNGGCTFTINNSEHNVSEVILYGMYSFRPTRKISI